MFKVIGILFCIGIASAIEYPGYGHPHLYHAPAVVKHVAPLVKYATPALVKHVEYDAPAHYDFSYSVHDHHTGDIKSQTESRKGDAVHGQYTLIDADGFHRIVDYTADDHNGFNAVVRREPLGHKVVKAVAPIAKVISPVHYAPAHYAPAHYAPAHYAPAPVHYAAPLAHHYASPIAKVAVAHAPAHVSFSAPGYAYHH